ncbi:FAD-dependent thymidylate synthase [Geobacillus stearothermophilus]|uniref:FAD-dependent thymidylate synthase n=1 Tax=Geobacillus stearothermophilus TaxID=1422 RepID=UPI002E1AADD1|nr:FAD-dependent thymidylate synthase [Geobacillus stearothermophilus]MED5041499.1 FAD-dependent thymidylate synthase [Geobacillus stearothermophilus]
MEVKLIAHTQLSEDFLYELSKRSYEVFFDLTEDKITDGQAVALTAIRTCYSHNKPSEIILKEANKYFYRDATDGQGGTEADRLIRHIVSSKHLSTLEHLTFTFAIEGVSRALLAQLTRHRVGFSFSVQSQRYCRFGSDDKSGGFRYVVPPSVEQNDHARREYELAMIEIQNLYDELRFLGVPPEDARFVLPQSATCNLVLTANLRALLDFYSKRRKGRGAQWEIAELAERLREAVVAVEPWADPFFEQA